MPSKRMVAGSIPAGGTTPGFPGVELGFDTQKAAALRNGRGQPDPVGPGDGLQLTVVAPDPGHDPAVVEPQPQLRAHRDRAPDALHDPDDIGGRSARGA
jgi:hypothetical protein